MSYLNSEYNCCRLWPCDLALFLCPIFCRQMIREANTWVVLQLLAACMLGGQRQHFLLMPVLANILYYVYARYLVLTSAPLGYFYNPPHWGGGFWSPPLISATTGPIPKIQTAFESPGKTVEGKQVLLTSGSRVTSQVRSKSKCSTFRAW